MTTQKERLEARLAIIVERLTKARLALNNIIESEVQGYEFSDGGGKQKAEQIKIEKLNELITSLEKQEDRINDQLNGVPRIAHVVYRR